ncbi:PAS domain-containing protein [uncultured Enterovirga sp.]|uniref:PAS domain-containing protein n=1 Tax=uncultured Enterovirga sp. TaxID=2026352 RepID=UPI0035CBFD62
MKFDTVTVADLDTAGAEAADAATFGIIGLSPDGIVDTYNRTESRLAGLSPERVVGQHFFTAVAPCMNNFMVSQRMDDESELDATIDYVLTLRMRPTPVKLRMLKSPGSPRRYILIQR